ncbi:MAG: TIGR03936 family radical SAM-associated protein [Chloroflexota bacterium]
MEPTSRPPAAAPGGGIVPAEPRQRWRVRFRRRADAPALAQREQLAAWEAALESSGLPLVGLDLPVPRPRIVLAAPLAVGMAADGELIDLFLATRLTGAEVRAAVADSLPTGHELVDLHDVWLGEPALSGRVAAADYRIGIGTMAGTPDRATLTLAAARLIGARTLLRTRDKGGRPVEYDLRPLVAAIEVLDTPRDAIQLRIRTRFDPERGVGRPEEVVAALSELIGDPLVVAWIVRERLVLGDEA